MAVRGMPSIPRLWLNRPLCQRFLVELTWVIGTSPLARE